MYFYYQGSLVRPYQIIRSFTIHFPYQVTPTLEVLFDLVDSWDEGSIIIPAFSPYWNFFLMLSEQNLDQIPIDISNW